jgi:hypothetical protein
VREAFLHRLSELGVQLYRVDAAIFSDGVQQMRDEVPVAGADVRDSRSGGRSARARTTSSGRCQMARPQLVKSRRVTPEQLERSNNRVRPTVNRIMDRLMLPRSSKSRAGTWPLGARQRPHDCSISAAVRRTTTAAPAGGTQCGVGVELVRRACQ